jgi:hypothetical protein
MSIVADIFSFKRIENNSILLGKDLNLRLLARIVEINPNTAFAKIEFSLVEEINKDSITKNIENPNYDFMIFSGGVIEFADSSIAFENKSRFNNEFIKFSNHEIIELGKLIQVKYKAEPIDIKIDAQPNGYLFPFDKYTMRINFELINKTGKVKQPTIDIKSDDYKFFVSQSIRNFSYGRRMKEFPNSFIIMFIRPKYVKINFILIALISLSIVIWSYYRILSSKTVTAVEILGLNITILLTFPTLRTILVPSNLEYAPIFDLCATLLWILSLTAIISYFYKYKTQ